MTALKPRQAPRRKGPDRLIHLVSWIGLVCWGLFVTSLAAIDRASPDMETLFSRFLGTPVRSEWDRVWSGYAINLMLTVFLFSALALFFQYRRHKRKTDHYSFSLLFLLVTSLAGTLFLLLGID